MNDHEKANDNTNDETRKMVLRAEAEAQAEAAAAEIDQGNAARDAEGAQAQSEAERQRDAIEQIGAAVCTLGGAYFPSLKRPIVASRIKAVAEPGGAVAQKYGIDIDSMGGAYMAEAALLVAAFALFETVREGIAQDQAARRAARAKPVTPAQAPAQTGQA